LGEYGFREVELSINRSLLLLGVSRNEYGRQVVLSMITSKVANEKGGMSVFMAAAGWPVINPDLDLSLNPFMQLLTLSRRRDTQETPLAQIRRLWYMKLSMCSL
jgi:hypothetical protein